MIIVRELKYETFLSHGRQPEVISKTIIIIIIIIIIFIQGTHSPWRLSVGPCKVIVASLVTHLRLLT